MDKVVISGTPGRKCRITYTFDFRRDPGWYSFLPLTPDPVRRSDDIWSEEELSAYASGEISQLTEDWVPKRVHKNEVGTDKDGNPVYEKTTEVITDVEALKTLLSNRYEINRENARIFNARKAAQLKMAMNSDGEWKDF